MAGLFSEEDISSLKLKKEITMCVPRGHFVIVHELSKKIVGTFMARHNYDGIHEYSGRIHWLVVHPDHRGKGLGFFLTALTVNRLIDIGYKTIFVGTNDEMLAAIKTYLKAGFVPNLFRQGMYRRWEKIYRMLNLEYTPEDWTGLKERMGIFHYLK